MKQLFQIHLEKIAVGAALAVVLAAAVWWWMQGPQLHAVRTEVVAVNLAGDTYERVKFRAPSGVPRAWSPPKPQSSGANWVYEVFTPPVIFYDGTTRSFVVTPPGNLRDSGLPFGIELLDVRRELYRLQLLGYVGQPGDFKIAFVSPKFPETMLVRTGHRFEELSLTLRDFTVSKVDISDDPDHPVYEVAAIATLYDSETGTTITLDNRSRKFTEGAVAILRFGAAAKPREVREGDTMQDDNVTYRIERIQLDPPEVVVGKQIPGLPYPETRVLKPGSSESTELEAKPITQRYDDARSTSVAASPQLTP